MKIESIYIENFRGIKKLDLSGFSNLNVIAGVNGAGKSSVLVALKILLSWFVARIRNAKGNGIAISDTDITNGKEFCLLKIKMDNGPEWQLYKQRSSVRTKAEYRTDLTKMSAYANEMAERLGKDTKSDILLIDSYGVNRVVNETPMRVRAAHKLSPIDALSVDMSNSVNFHDFFIWFREMEDIENETLRNTGTLTLDKRLESVRRAASMLLDGYSDFKVLRSPKKSFVIKKGDETFDFNQLSDGEKSYMVLIFDIARKISMTHPSLDNPLNGDGIVLIDEIDLHLHPSWQREVIGKLQTIFPHCQFFVSTHSPHVVSSVNPRTGNKLIVVADGECEEVSINKYGRESDFVLADIFRMDSLRAPEVQSYIDKIWEHLRRKDYESEGFNTAYNWLKENVDRADAVFAQINLQIALIKKEL
jgi:predicted ATP-binding protein involved in virulence